MLPMVVIERCHVYDRGGVDSARRQKSGQAREARVAFHDPNFARPPRETLDSSTNYNAEQRTISDGQQHRLLRSLWKAGPAWYLQLFLIKAIFRPQPSCRQRQNLNWSHCH